MNLSKREKWLRYLKGEDVGPMVSPLCDDWSLDQPYRWPFEEPDPFPPGSSHHQLSQQLAMGGICGWDPTFLASVQMSPRNAAARPETRTEQTARGKREESCIHTPYGDFTSITEVANSGHAIKEWLETEEDYRKALWVTQQQMDYDEDAAIAEGKQLCKAVGNRGVLGTWFWPPNVNFINRDDMFYHMADWPGAYQELHAATTALYLKQIGTIRKARFDYLFYCVDGTEWTSPEFFRSHVRENTREIFARWRADGGFILWHTCGHAKSYVEQGFYNEMKPEIFETLSVPPVGNLPSLAWARQRLDPAIITKGNVPLNLLLNGPTEEIRNAVRQIRQETRGYRHVIGLSDDLFHNSPLANCQAFVEAGREL